jgi:hypothetical protein
MELTRYRVAFVVLLIALLVVFATGLPLWLRFVVAAALIADTGAAVQEWKRGRHAAR